MQLVFLARDVEYVTVLPVALRRGLGSYEIPLVFLGAKSTYLWSFLYTPPFVVPNAEILNI